MAASARHRGWKYSKDNGILAATYNGAEDGTSVLATNTTLDGVLVGTPVTPALAVDSMIISNAVASGDILIAANNGGNSQAWVNIDSSAGTMTLFGAGTAASIISSAAVEMEDNILLALGNDQDQVLLNRAASLNANTALTGVLSGTPAVAAIPANSLIVSNVTANGDQVFATLIGGTNSAEWLRCDTSAGLVVFNEDSADIDFRIESNGNANMFVIDGGDNTVGIGGAAVANQTVTVTNSAVAATGRLMKLTGTVAAAALTDGYGAFEVDVTLSGSPTDHSAAASAWVNITGGTVPAGTYICARNDGIYEESAATITNAKLIFGSRMQYIATDTDGLRFPFSLNTNNTAITAVFDCNNYTDFGAVANAGTALNIMVPFCRDAGGTLRYVPLYALQ